MSEAPDKALLDAINSTKEGVGKAVDFAIEQAPDVIQQLLLWKAAESIVKTVVGILCFVAVYALYRFIKNYPQPRGYDPNNLVWSDAGELNPITAVFGSMLFVCLVVAGARLINLTWLKIWIAPKLFLIEYAASLVK